MKAIAIIGAGLSGTMLAMNLLKQKCSRQVNIKLIDRGGENNLGPAYSTNEDYLLNVPAELMGAFSKEPEHFINWALEKNIKTGKGDYLPRKLLREYIQEMFHQAFKEKGSSIIFQRIEGEAVDVKTEDDHLKVFMEVGSSFDADKVVLALGNAPPRTPKIKNPSSLKEKRYINNPWDPDVLKDFHRTTQYFLSDLVRQWLILQPDFLKKSIRGK